MREIFKLAIASKSQENVPEEKNINVSVTTIDVQKMKSALNDIAEQGYDSIEIFAQVPEEELIKDPETAYWRISSNDLTYRLEFEDGSEVYSGINLEELFSAFGLE